MESCPPFVRKTFALVSDNDTNSIITWTESEKSFVILNAVSFEKQILPLFFKHSNLSSFIRQLNTYRFNKVSCSHEGLEFSHPHFQRGKPELLRLIRRGKRQNRPANITISRSESITVLLQLNQNIERSQERLQSLQQELNQVRSQLNHLRNPPEPQPTYFNYNIQTTSEIQWTEDSEGYSFLSTLPELPNWLTH